MGKRGRSKSSGSKSASAKRKRLTQSPSTSTINRRYKSARDFDTTTKPSRRRSTSPVRIDHQPVKYYSPRKAPWLWTYVKKDELPAVDKVLSIHARGKPGDGDWVYVSVGKYYEYVIKAKGDQRLALFLTAMWSVRLEIYGFMRSSSYFGNDTIQAIVPVEGGSQCIHPLNLDTLALLDWYLGFLSVWPAITSKCYVDHTEIARRCDTNEDEDDPAFTVALINAGQREDDSFQPSTPSTPAQAVFEANGSTLETFLFITKLAMQTTPLCVRVEQLINVINNPNDDLPEGWYSPPPPQYQATFCVPLVLISTIRDQARLREAAEEIMRLDSDPPSVQDQQILRSIHDYCAILRGAAEYEGSSHDVVRDLNAVHRRITGGFGINIETPPQIREEIPDILHPAGHINNDTHPTAGTQPTYMDGFGGTFHVCRCFTCTEYLRDFVYAALEHAAESEEEYDDFNVGDYTGCQLSAYLEHLEKPQDVDIDAMKHLQPLVPYPFKQEKVDPIDVPYVQHIDLIKDTTPPHTPVGLDLLPLGATQYSPSKEKDKRRKLGSPSTQYILAKEPAIVITSNGEDDEGEMQYEFVEAAPISVETKTRQPGDLGGIPHADMSGTTSGGITHTQPSTSSFGTQPGPSSARSDIEDNLYFMKKRWDNFEANPLTYDKGFVNHFLEMSPWENQIDVVDMALGSNLHLVHTTDYFGGALHNIAALGTRALGDYKAAKALYALEDYIKDFQRAIPKYVWDRMIDAFYPTEAATRAKEAAAYKVKTGQRQQQQKQQATEGGIAYRSVAPPVGKIPVMEGPTTASGGWRIPPPVAPPYVAAHRARVGYRPRVQSTFRKPSPTPSLLGAPGEPPRPVPAPYTSITQTPPYTQHTPFLPIPQPPGPFPQIPIPALPPQPITQPMVAPTPFQTQPAQPTHQGGMVYDYGSYQYVYYPPRVVMTPAQTHTQQPQTNIPHGTPGGFWIPRTTS